ncbi:MAG: bifunctional (p)ppGpp synthetase/guanosine-3',5'-bis(diphosphate) 3'-pyrophosphohydrolase [Spirochaetales bacterium]|nr:bifunctional (p)ppGpp synthetase/guanosine-3',5'-bis(diphosphate) 3'-pyrophosphohydrolase [Spirochaetales bacterium]
MQELISELRKKIEKKFSKSEVEKIIEAANWSNQLHKDQKRRSGEPYFIHPINVAKILIEMRLDSDTIIAALLHDLIEDTETSFDDIEKKFGKEIANLVDGVTKISYLKTENKTQSEAETIRKMLFAMSKDIRVILIKLADKLHNMSTLEFLPTKNQKKNSLECLEIYAPLAERLGISWMKAELEDLSLKYLHPDEYEHIRMMLETQINESKDYLNQIKNEIKKAAKEHRLTIDVSTRVKHYYSIYNKMKQQVKNANEVHDLLGIRVVCDTTTECYTLLGLAHNLWPPIEGRFKDYIAMPKANGYQSLHTTVMCYSGHIIEIQIRTKEMHYNAEYGIAAHWAYKKRIDHRNIKLEELNLINKIKSWSDEITSSTNLLDEIKHDILKDSIYVFTPEGKILELPKGATPIDFAYHIHTEVGDHCMAAKADGVIIPLNQALNNTQVIEIITNQGAHPNINWLRIAKTARARNKIRHWLTIHDENVIINSSIVAKKPQKNEKPVEKTPEKQETTRQRPSESEFVTSYFDKAKLGIRVGKENNIMIKLAKCCTPSSGDEIIGYISRGRGIIVHRKNCNNLASIPDFVNRSIEVEWEPLTPKKIINITVKSRYTTDLFSEIEGAIRQHKAHLIEGKITEDSDRRLIGYFVIELDNKDDAKKIKKSIRLIPSILNLEEK